MLAIVASLIVFVSVLLIAFLAVFVASQVLERTAPTPAETEDPAASLFKDEVVSTISPFARLLSRFNFIHEMRVKLAEAGLDWSVGRVCAMMLLTGSLAMAFASGIPILPGWVLPLLALLGALAPYFYVLHVRSKRFEKFESMFPEALDSLVRALRAGHPFAAGMELLAMESMPPVSVEMRKTLEEWKLGMSWNQALDNLVERVPVLDVAVFAAAVKLQIRTGGHLGEVLAKLAESMRENSAIQGEVRALAAHGRLTGRILSVLPVFIAGMMFVVNPDQMAILLTHPIGKNLIVIAILCLVAAHFIIRRLVDIRL